MSKHPVHQTIDQIGAEFLAQELGVSEFSIRAAKRARKFPATWCDVVEQLCKEKDFPAPSRKFFGMRERSAA
ncbi:hypothetical protein ATO8_09171 [Roseivivax marinus]|jgi:hypothetical protein|uniref:Uncharacterized protein n=1 Tax=Roseivivax marinus TaxID=1379903 RepID=W4HKX0_9RHOB|nr:hypothetical protein [Roseivivax marinus]ETW13372.1 hypothetical protein ATO8_09171 [Roseivivax marinus]